MSNTTLLLLTLLLPFGTTIVLLGVRALPWSHENATRILSIASPIIVALSMVTLFVRYDSPYTMELFSWIALGELFINVELYIDALSLVMGLFITLISALIFIYATAYMRHDAGYTRFFIYFHLFLGFMLLLVLANNPYMMFVGWEGVGLASYLLIGFYSRDLANTRAANKAFYLNRIGDFGFIIALGLIFVQLGTYGLDWSALEQSMSELDDPMLIAIGLGLFVGAMGKSAQIPLYVWLPDAMAGPTPVSALIHAATMVTAGVYMVVRFDFLYTLIPDVGLFIATMGALSALLAALFATFATDVKKILAYSTMSQLGFMFAAAGTGLYDGAIFHLFTHAFFKALLFLGAGAIIVALHHEQNIFRMGNMRHFMPIVFVSMFFATATISGIPPFSGFFSKDAIVAHLFLGHYYGLWAILMSSAFLTSYYMFRLFFTLFLAPSPTPRQTILPVSLTMQWPLILLALGAVGNGLWNIPTFMGGNAAMHTFLALSTPVHEVAHTTEWLLSMGSALVALLGMALAYRHYAHAMRPPKEARWRWLIDVLYIDHLYHALFVRSLRALSLWFATYPERLLQRSVYTLQALYWQGAHLLQRLQDGRLQTYMFLFAIGVALLSLMLLAQLKGWL